MPSQSTILGTALLVSAAMAAPQITTTVSQPVIGLPGVSVQGTAINPQVGDYQPPLGGGWGGLGGFNGGFGGYNGGFNGGYGGWNGGFGGGFGGLGGFGAQGVITPQGQYDNECSEARRWRGQCTLDQQWGNGYFKRSEESASKVEKRAEAAKSSENQWGPIYGGVNYGWGLNTYRPAGWGFQQSWGYPRWGNRFGGGWGNSWGNSWGSPYGFNQVYWRQGQETASDAAAAPADLTAEATTTVQNTKRDLNKRQWGGRYVTYNQWQNYWNALRQGQVGSAAFSGINPSFTIDNGGLPTSGNPFPGYPSFYPGYIPAYPWANGGQYGQFGQFGLPGYTGVASGAAQVPGLVGTFSLDETK